MLFVKKNKIFTKVFILLLLLIVSCGPSEQEIQAQIDEAVETAVEEVLEEVTTTSSSTTTIPPITTSTTFKDTNFSITGTKNNELKEIISLGVKVYDTNCLKCHKANLQGADNWKTDKDEDGHRLAPPLNGYGHTWHHSPEQIFNTIRYGLVFFDASYEGKMKANNKLTDDEIWSVIEYMHSVWPEDIQSEYQDMFLSE